MTAGVFGDAPELPAGTVDPLSTDHVVNLVRFLASPVSGGVNGQLFIVYGPTVTLVAAPVAEHQFTADADAWEYENSQTRPHRPYLGSEVGTGCLSNPPRDFRHSPRRVLSAATSAAKKSAPTPKAPQEIPEV